ncbi:MAG: hypothetical protein HYU33_07020 [Candidatus Omnitrophica bacterium]|nr:hypothetical protein [Candidatus Omnitrophota bacterium]
MKNQSLKAASALIVSLFFAGSVQAQNATSERTESETAVYRNGRYQTAELYASRWSAGGGLGLIGSTPDGTALAATSHVEYFVNEQLSVGPLLQLGFTDDMTQIGLSGQAKYWVDLPGTAGRSKVNLQSGVGFTHADFRADDSSWLVPLGVGFEQALQSGQSLTANLLLNFTDLNTGAGTGADVMPSFMFGLRF